MYEDTTIGVVVPAYNEAAFVGTVIETVPSFVDVVYAVDDDSTDDTVGEMRRAAATWADRETGPNVEVIRHRENRGVGGAIKTGYLRARADRIDVTVVLAGDGQMDVEIFEDVIQPIVDGDAEYVKANRFLSPEEIEQMPRHRRVGNRILEGLTRIASGYWSVGDPQSGYTAISLDALDELDVENIYEFYGYCNEILVRLNARECRVVDVPSPVRYEDEESGISLDSYVPRVSFMLLRSFLWRLHVRYVARNQRDVPALYGLGGLGVLTGLVALVRRRDRKGGMKGSVRSLTIGVLALGMAILVDRASNRHLDDTRTESGNRQSD